MTQRRRHDRFQIELGADITTSAVEFAAVTKDVSAGGCCITSAYELSEGTEVGCSLFLVVDGIEEAGFGVLETRATVQWAADTEEVGPGRYVAGLRFVDLGAEQQAWIEKILARGSTEAGN